tara:strand:- start:367 stop:765 length:399 start_codon:yes stop_codon:yes gene_type:complete
MIKLSKNTHKYKFNRRRALECKFVEKSKKNPGYLKYTVTIGEKDGTKHTQPVYGKDMQDALSRLIKKELTKKVENKLETSTGFVFVVWVTLMLLPAMFVNAQPPWFLAYVFGSIALLTVVAIAWYNHVNKGE